MSMAVPKGREPRGSTLMWSDNPLSNNGALLEEDSVDELRGIQPRKFTESLDLSTSHVNYYEPASPVKKKDFINGNLRVEHSPSTSTETSEFTIPSPSKIISHPSISESIGDSPRKESVETPKHTYYNNGIVGEGRRRSVTVHQGSTSLAPSAKPSSAGGGISTSTSSSSSDSSDSSSSSSSNSSSNNNNNNNSALPPVSSVSAPTSPTTSEAGGQPYSPRKSSAPHESTQRSTSPSTPQHRSTSSLPSNLGSDKEKEKNTNNKEKQHDFAKAPSPFSQEPGGWKILARPVQKIEEGEKKKKPLTLLSGWKVLKPKKQVIETKPGVKVELSAGWRVLAPPTVTLQDERGSVALTSGWKLLKPAEVTIEDEKGKVTLTNGWKVLKKETVDVETDKFAIKGEKHGWRVLTPKPAVVTKDKKGGEFVLPAGWSVLKKEENAVVPSTDTSSINTNDNKQLTKTNSKSSNSDKEREDSGNNSANNSANSSTRSISGANRSRSNSKSKKGKK